MTGAWHEGKPIKPHWLGAMSILVQEPWCVRACMHMVPLGIVTGVELLEHNVFTCSALGERATSLKWLLFIYIPTSNVRELKLL